MLGHMAEWDVDCPLDLVTCYAGLPAGFDPATEVFRVFEYPGKDGRKRLLETLKKREAVKGEITLLIGKAKEDHVEAAATDRQTVRQRVEQIMAEEKIDEKAALKKVAKERGVSKSEAYREWQREVAALSYEVG